MQDKEIFERFSKLYTALIADTLDGIGFRDQTMDFRIRPLYPEAIAVGRALTVLSAQYYKIPEDPYQKELAALDNVKEGEVFVATTNGELTSGFWGELMSTAAKAGGANGTITDGLTRDARQIIRMKYPVFARGHSACDSNGRSIVVDYNVPIVCGGVKVNPGDMVFADYEGIVVIPKGYEEEILLASEEKFYGENKVRSELAAGEKASVVFKKYGIL